MILSIYKGKINVLLIKKYKKSPAKMFPLEYYIIGGNRSTIEDSDKSRSLPHFPGGQKYDFINL